MRTFAVIALAMLLAGCAGDLTEGAGQTRLTVDRQLAPKGQTAYTRTFTLIAGKEYASIRIDIAYDGDKRPVVKIEARGVAAFEGQKAAARMVNDMTAALAKAGVSITPAIVDGIVKAMGLP